MPIYEFFCRNCGKRVEALILSATATPNCPQCGKPLNEKLISAPHFLRRSGEKPSPGHTCCGREERCEQPPCSQEGGCRR